MTWTTPLIPPLARHLEPELRRRIDQKTKPLGSLGRLETLALQLGLIQQTVEPALLRPTIVVFAGDHGMAVEGVSPYPSEVTAQMVLNYLAGGAAINVFARQNGLTLKVVDSGVAVDLPPHAGLVALKVRRGTRNALHEPALTPKEVELCLTRGVQVVADLASGGTNALLLGEMGIGNTSPAALIQSALLKLPLADCVGRGAGHDDAGLKRKRDILEKVKARHVGAGGPLEVLGAFGGCEIAMLVGAILAGAANRMVVVIDGFIVTAALLVASRLSPTVVDYCVFAHTSGEAGHTRALAALDARPLLDLELHLGEGTGAALAWPLIVAAAGFLREMATFESAGVSERQESQA